MTISILAFDEKSGRLGGAAATGSLCVGGWVLRGHAESGLSASQGSAPSTLWGEGVLARMKEGASARDAVRAMTDPDTGRAERQLAALDLNRGTAHFTGDNSVPHASAVTAPGVVVAGNMLTGPAVLQAALDAFLTSPLPFAERLMAALGASAREGGDVRGYQSAALLIVGRDIPPLTLRIDHAADPLGALADLHARATAEPYHGWLRVVPVTDDPFRAPTEDDKRLFDSASIPR